MSNECIAQTNSGNVGLAFGLVTAAGLSTTLGAALAFVLPYSRSAKNLTLASCLAIAAGVMLYVSFIEIFAVKTVGEFQKCADEGMAYLYATLCLFGGVLITVIFDFALHYFQNWISVRKGKKSVILPDTTEQRTNDNQTNQLTIARDERNLPSNGQDEPMNIDNEIAQEGQMVADMYTNHEHDAKSLIRMGIFAGIALAFHNFPEGLATFVSVLEDPRVGASVAVAIGIHNIPEGICVAMPIYYATGSRIRAFVWATLSGMTELVGALLGWFILRKVFTPIAYAVLFGIVGGMMIYISLKELLPTAHRYDPEDKVTTKSLIAGMAVMALSLVLFQF